ncbi:M28 family peptidase [[Limnothrix rosea] IAM M-220]|uniref:M28 family peptidase n=1 Tax=[Limnothrix rosea] IAM M-220 TaxID=454133 RepID=UPI00095C86D9|nr:M28 family peptidase [[Limnothrix rosea] IAM M-220]OKH10805.1 peptidase M28 [[Limnothrix rosea] IAM M-220]
MVDELKTRLTQHLKQIIRNRDPYFSTVGHFYVKEYARQMMAQYGEPETFHFEVEGKTHENIILNLCTDATIQSKPPILIGAHYDAVINSPGADDNATGLAVLLEMAKFFSENSARYPMRFVAFDLEEFGLQGSFNYAAHLRKKNQPLRLMLSLEMLGFCSHEPNSQNYPSFLKYFYPSTGNFIALVGDIQTIPEMWGMQHQIKKSVSCEWLPAGWRGYPVPDARRSDHVAFWEQGYKAMMVTDTANLRNPHYHKPSDTFETLDLDFLTNVCTGLCEAIAVL